MNEAPEPVQDGENVDGASEELKSAAEEEEEPEWLRDAAEKVNDVVPKIADAVPDETAGPALLTEDFVCQYCDAETSTAVSARLLDVLAARRAEGSKRCVDDLVQKHIRERLLPPKKPAKKNAPPPDLYALQAALHEMSVAKASGLGGLFTSKEELAKRFDKERKELDVSFRHSQRLKLAAELIFAYDMTNEWHCGAVVEAGEASPRSVNAAEQHRLKCIFRPLACRNEGCVHLHSALHEARHDAECPFKLLVCTRGCGQQVIRSEMANHVDGPCPMKPCDCTFVQIGCKVPCTQGGLAEHLETHAAQHLSLTLKVVTAQQRSINELQAAQAAQAALSTSSAAQQKELHSLRARVDTLEEQRDAMAERMRVSEQELRSALSKAKAELGAQSSKDVRRVEEALGKQVKTVAAAAKDDSSKLAAAHERLRAAVEGVSARLGER